LLDGNSLVAYWSNSYGNGMPEDAPGSSTYYGQNFNYWVNGTIVPAPGALAALGLLGLLGARRRR
ncbi:MAG: PEP-CTERM sorting domain-containing protein, partial [Planctomycetota bacterium]|nr:PEP-CTERM sorting domain-containing protein [Planctomycetota bacterium]